MASFEAGDQHVELTTKRCVGQPVCRRLCTNDDIHLTKAWNEPQPHQLTESSTQTVSFDNRVTMFANNDSNTRIGKQGVAGPDLEILGTQSSPCFFDPLKI